MRGNVHHKAEIKKYMFTNVHRLFILMGNRLLSFNNMFINFQLIFEKLFCKKKFNKSKIGHFTYQINKLGLLMQGKHFFQVSGSIFAVKQASLLINYQHLGNNTGQQFYKILELGKQRIHNYDASKSRQTDGQIDT